MADERETALTTAHSYLQSGRLADAEQLYRKVVAASPAGSAAVRAQALTGLGSTLLALGRREEAIASFEEAVALAPDLVEAHYEMGVALSLLKRDDEAVAIWEKALAIDPDFAEAACALGRALDALGRHEDAIGRFEQALDVDPDYAEARFGLATVELALGRHTDALASFDKALASQPDHAASLCGRARVLSALGRHDEAVASCERAAALSPADARIAVELAHALDLAERTSEAIAVCERAVSLDPNLASAHAELGSLRAISGDIDAGRAAYDKALALEPRNPEHYLTAVAARRVARDEPLLRRMEALASDIASLSDAEQASLHLALGKAYADVGEHERSFQHFLAGRTLKRRAIHYNARTAVGLMRRIEQIFTSTLMASRAGSGDPSPAPIFVVGMPRSGTTLTEQILASHPDVFGGGERRALAPLAGPTFPDNVPALPPDAFRALGATYVAGLTALAPTAARITDKLPSNYIYIGLIRLAMPNAHIIHMRRDPIDTCLSCFTTAFKGDFIPFSYDLGELGQQYRAYARLMAHWRTVLGADAFLEVDYEALVADFEPQARRIIDYCGLPWNDSCLAFYDTRRPVRTASMVQVRQPIYNSSVGKWRPPDPVLKPLLDALEE
jgi:tetratricopeptide (TPR) repeat protein